MKIGDLVRDNYNRLGIIVARGKKPTKEWLSVQNDPRDRKLPARTVWWEVLPLSGGGVYTPQPLTEYIRKATIQDFNKAMRNANDFGRDQLAAISPYPFAWQCQKLRS